MRHPASRHKTKPQRATQANGNLLILFNKPWGVLSQFSGGPDEQTLSDYISAPGCYPAGRLDKDSEGLLLLTNNGKLQHRIAHPDKKLLKTYWVQVEGNISDSALQQLRQGIELKDGPTRPALADRMQPPDWLWARNPPVRFRKSIPTCWVSLSISEGRNRQIRRMTAATGFPTLRLIRYAIGNLNIENLALGQSQKVSLHGHFLLQ